MLSRELFWQVCCRYLDSHHSRRPPLSNFCTRPRQIQSGGKNMHAVDVTTSHELLTLSTLFEVRTDITHWLLHGFLQISKTSTSGGEISRGGRLVHLWMEDALYKRSWWYYFLHCNQRLSLHLNLFRLASTFKSLDSLSSKRSWILVFHFFTRDLWRRTVCVWQCYSVRR